VARRHAVAAVIEEPSSQQGLGLRPFGLMRGIKYRYYLSSILLQGQPERAGAVSRIPAAAPYSLKEKTF
jgi:hypothetical protein